MWGTAQESTLNKFGNTDQVRVIVRKVQRSKVKVTIIYQN